MSSQSDIDSWKENLPNQLKEIINDNSLIYPTFESMNTHPRIPTATEMKNETLLTNWMDWFRGNSCTAVDRFFKWIDAKENKQKSNVHIYDKMGWCIGFFYLIQAKLQTVQTSNKAGPPSVIDTDHKHSPVSTVGDVTATTYFSVNDTVHKMATALMIAFTKIIKGEKCTSYEIQCLDMCHQYKIPSLSFFNIPKLTKKWFGTTLEAPKEQIIYLQPDKDKKLFECPVDISSINIVVHQYDSDMYRKHKYVLADLVARDNKNGTKQTTTMIKLYPVFATMQLTYGWTEEEWAIKTINKKTHDSHIPLSPEHAAYATFWTNYQELIGDDYDVFRFSKDRMKLVTYQEQYLEYLENQYILNKIGSPVARGENSSKTGSIGHFTRNFKERKTPNSFDIFIKQFETFAATADSKTDDVKAPDVASEDAGSSRPPKHAHFDPSATVRYDQTSSYDEEVKKTARETVATSASPADSIGGTMNDIAGGVLGYQVPATSNRPPKRPCLESRTSDADDLFVLDDDVMKKVYELADKLSHRVSSLLLLQYGKENIDKNFGIQNSEIKKESGYHLKRLYKLIGYYKSYEILSKALENDQLLNDSFDDEKKM